MHVNIKELVLKERVEVGKTRWKIFLVYGFGVFVLFCACTCRKRTIAEPKDVEGKDLSHEKGENR